MYLGQLILFFILLLMSSFFSGSEIALMSTPEHKVNAMIKLKRSGARTLKKIKENTDRLLITILIGNNIVNILMTVLATTIAIGLAQKYNFDKEQTIGIVTVVLTILILLFGEIIPKSIGTKNSSVFSLLAAPIYKVLMFIAFPLVVFLEVIIKFFSGTQKIHKVTNEEIENFIDMGRRSGTLEKDEHEKLLNVLDFNDTLVEEVMIPRVRMDCLSSTTKVGDAIEYYLKHTHSRIPVFEKVIDKIDTFLTIRDIISEDKDKKLSELNLPKVLKVPLNQSINKLLKIFQSNRMHLAVVIDEYGGVAGIVTLEDILEEITGEIRDEKDEETDQIKEISKNTFIVESGVIFDDILDKFELSFEDVGLDKREFSGETLSYIITHKLQRFPINGEKIDFIITKETEKNKKLELDIQGFLDGKIGKVEIKKLDNVVSKKV